MAALRGGVGPAVAAGVSSVVILNVFFTEPRYTFLVRAEQDVVTLGFFLLVALITGQLAARAKRQVDVIRAGGARMVSLTDFSRRLAGAVGQDDVASVLVDCPRSTLGLDAIVLFPDYASALAVAAGDTAGDLTDAERDAATWAFERREPTGWGTSNAANAAWFFVSIKGTTTALLQLGDALAPDDKRELLENILEETERSIATCRTCST